MLTVSRQFQTFASENESEIAKQSWERLRNSVHREQDHIIDEHTPEYRANSSTRCNHVRTLKSMLFQGCNNKICEAYRNVSSWNVFGKYLLNFMIFNMFRIYISQTQWDLLHTRDINDLIANSWTFFYYQFIYLFIYRF